MKKLITLTAAVVSAALFFGCSDSSDNNNAALLLAASSSSSGVSLPESVGENELAGKSFNLVGFSETWKFSSNSVSVVHSSDCKGVSNKYSEYNREHTVTYSYSYNTETKRIYLFPVSDSTVITRYGESVVLPALSFATDAGFINALVAQYKVIYDKVTSYTTLEYMAEIKRYDTFREYGYTDSSNMTEVSRDIIARYNRAQSLKTITAKVYNLSSDGKIFKFATDSTYCAPGTTLQDIYSAAYAGKELDITSNSTTVYTLSYGRQYECPECTPALMSSDLLTGYKVSSITSDRINLSAIGIRLSSNVDFDYTSGDFYLNYDTTEVANGVKYTIKDLLSDTTMGEITINYATSSNIPDVSYAPKYALVE